MTVSDWLGAVTAILLFLLTTIVGIIGYMFRDLRDSVRDNSRHVAGLIANDSELLWRVTGAEDFMQERLDYRPPRLIRQQWNHGIGD